MQLVHTTSTLPVIPTDQREPRAAGLHVSTIIHDLCEDLYPDRFGPSSGFDEWLDGDIERQPKVWLGQAYDWYLDRVLSTTGQHAIKPGGLEFEGVWLTADRLLWEGPRNLLEVEGCKVDGRAAQAFLIADTEAAAECEHFLIEEHKCTWMTLRYGVTDLRFAHWFWQLKAYCWCWNTRRARLRVFAVNNDYNPKIPNYFTFDILFTAGELKANWSALMRHRHLKGLR